MRFAKCSKWFEQFKIGDLVGFELVLVGDKIMVDIFKPVPNSCGTGELVRSTLPQIFQEHFCEYFPMKLEEY